METIKDKNKEVETIFNCTCGDTGHKISIRYDEDYVNPCYSHVYVSIYLGKEHTLLKRLKMAFKYAFGDMSKHGYFDEFIFMPKDWKKLQNVVNHLKKIDNLIR